MDKIPSEQQKAIFSWMETGKGNLLVRARAGTGKTTTIVKGVEFAPERKIMLCAFNKKIQIELNNRITNPNAEAKTLHSIGFSFVRRHWRGVKMENDRGQRIVDSILDNDVPREISRLVVRLVSRAKSTRPFGTVSELMIEAQDADLIPDDEFIDMGYGLQFIAEKAAIAMEKACQHDGTLDFDDMVFVPVRNKWVFGMWDLVIVDEAQDMSYTQLLLAQKICKKGGRVVVVGDDRQAIYGFRGADHRSLDMLKSSLKATELGLTITYRCPKSVVTLAQLLVPDYQFAPNAPEGEVSNTTLAKLVNEAAVGDFVLSRKNAPLAKVCLAFLKAHKRAFIEGRDIGQTLLALIKKMKAKSMPDFITRLEKWKEREMTRAQKLDTEAKREAKQEFVIDQHELLMNIADGLASVRELENRITSLFADMDDGSSRHSSSIVCSSVHRAKGLERDNVFLLEETFSERNMEERNIKYVGITRAKKRLVWVAKNLEGKLVPNPDGKERLTEISHSYDAHMINVGMKHHGDDFVREERRRQGEIDF